MKEKILLIDGDKTRFPNLALMKISAWHKNRGDGIFMNENGIYHKVYISCVFPENWKGILERHIFSGQSVFMGGSGFSMMSELPEEIEFMKPDYELYGKRFSLGFVTRGCDRRCPWCIVPLKEGKLKFWQDPREFYDPDLPEIKLLDNNFLQLYPGHLEMLNILYKLDKIVDFNQGLDIRLLNILNVAKIAKLRTKILRFAYDSINMKDVINEGIELLKIVGIRLNKLMFYMLINYNTSIEEDLQRIYHLKSISNDIDIYPMIYNKKESSRLHRELQRWCVLPQFRKTCSFEEFLRLRGAERLLTEYAGAVEA